MLTDIEIAQAANPDKITDVAERAGVDERYLECYGNYKAKVDYNLLREEEHTPGKLVLVTAINPPSARRTTCWPRCWMRTSRTATSWASTCARSRGSAWWT